MINKIKAILGSIRFWHLVAIAALQVLVGVGVIDGATSELIVKAIQGVLGGSVVIGTLDSVAKGFAGTKK